MAFSSFPGRIFWKTYGRIKSWVEPKDSRIFFESSEEERKALWWLIMWALAIFSFFITGA